MTFQDLQQIDNPMNGTALESAAALAELFDSLDTREPFLFELCGNNGFILTVGFAGDRGCVQYGSSDGSTPYLVALADDAADANQFIEFLAEDTPTPIPDRFCLPIEQVEGIAIHFLASGGRSGAVRWEEI